MSIISLHLEDLFGIAAGTKQEIKSEEVDDVKSDCMFNSGLVYWKNEQKLSTEKTSKVEDPEESRCFKNDIKVEDEGVANPEDIVEDMKIVAELIKGNFNDTVEINLSDNNGYSDLDSIPTSSCEKNSLLYKCLYCPYSSTNHDQFVSHQAFYACPLLQTVCNEKFLCKLAFEQHMSSAHPNFVLRTCKNSCDVSKINGNLNIHDMKTVHSDEVPNESGDFNAKSRCNSHLHLKHKPKKPQNILSYQCSDCDATFKKKYTLNRHFRLKHSDIRPYKCSDCGSGFKDKWDLNRHLRTNSKHSDIRPHQCTDCDAKFKKKCDFNRHLRTEHSDIRPYQ